MVVVRKLTNVGVYLGVGYLVPQLDAFLFKYQIQGDIAEKPWTGVSGVDGCKNINFLDEKQIWQRNVSLFSDDLYCTSANSSIAPQFFCWSA
jgi:hypothetical protein